MQTCLPGDTQHRAAVPRAGRPWAHHPPPRPGPTRSSRLPLPRATRLSRPLRVFCLRERRCHPSPRTARHPGQHSTLRPRLPAPEHQLHQAGRPGGPAKAVLRAGDAESRAGPCPLPAVPPTPAAKPASSCLPGSPEARASGGTESHAPRPWTSTSGQRAVGSAHPAPHFPPGNGAQWGRGQGSTRSHPTPLCWGRAGSLDRTSSKVTSAFPRGRGVRRSPPLHLLLTLAYVCVHVPVPRWPRTPGDPA